MSKILTIEEAQTRLKEKGCVTDIEVTVDNQKVTFFTDSHGHVPMVGADHWIPVTTYFTAGKFHVKARSGLEDGIVRNMDDFIRVFHANEKIVQSQKELIDFIVEKKPYMAEAFQNN